MQLNITMWRTVCWEILSFVDTYARLLKSSTWLPISISKMSAMPSSTEPSEPGLFQALDCCVVFDQRKMPSVIMIPKRCRSENKLGIHAMATSFTLAYMMRMDIGATLLQYIT